MVRPILARHPCLLLYYLSYFTPLYYLLCREAINIDYATILAEKQAHHAVVSVLNVIRDCHQLVVHEGMPVKALSHKLERLIVRVHSLKSHFIEYLQPEAISCFDHGSHEYGNLNILRY